MVPSHKFAAKHFIVLLLFKACTKYLPEKLDAMGLLTVCVWIGSAAFEVRFGAQSCNNLTGDGLLWKSIDFQSPWTRSNIVWQSKLWL